MRAFIQYCKKFPQIATTHYATQLESLQSLGKDIDNIPLNTVCNCLDLSAATGVFSLNDYTPDIIYFKGIDKAIMGTIMDVINLDSSKLVLFNHFFGQACRKLFDRQQKPIEIKESIGLLWSMTVADLKNILSPIESGLIKLTQLDTILDTFFDSNFAGMQAEISYLLDFFKVEGLDERKGQIDMWNRFTFIFFFCLFLVQIIVPTPSSYYKLQTLHYSVNF